MREDYWIEKQKQIRKHYEYFWKDIKEQYPRWDPYAIIPIVDFTPIEKNVWEDIRWFGLPLLPQFPAENFFIDFADPFKRLAIEVDGKDYHKDKLKDEKREMILRKKGWTIYRLTGRETCYTREDYEEYENSNRDLHTDSQRLLTFLKENYY